MSKLWNEVTGEHRMRRTDDGWEISERALRHVTLVVTLVGGIFSLGISWGAARIATESKLDARVFELHEKDISAHISASDYRSAMLIERLDRLDARLTAIYCDGKPAGCQ